MKKESLELKTISASKWSFFAHFASNSIKPISTIILAGILSPEDFGIVAISTSIVLLCQVLNGSGMSQALIQTKDDIKTSANLIFFTNVGLSLFVYTLLFFTANFIAVFYNDSRLILLIQIQGILVIIRSLSAVHSAILKKSLNFKSIFKVQIFSTIISSIFFSIPLALLGFGYWAIVMGEILGALIELGMIWRGRYWKPSLIFNLVKSKTIIRFGWWVSIEFLLSWLVSSLDIMILGYYVELNTLGKYQLAKTILLLIFSIVLEPFVPVWFSYFSKLQDNFEKIRINYIRITKICTMISLPMGIGMFLIADHVIYLFFESKWYGMETIMAFLGLSYGFTRIFGGTASVFKSINHPEIQPKIILVTILYQIPIFTITASIGLDFFLLAVFCQRIITSTAYLYYLNKYLDINPLRLFQQLKYIFIAVSIMILCINSFLKFVTTLSIFLNFTIIIIIGILSYFSTLYILDNSFLKMILGLIHYNARIEK